MADLKKYDKAIEAGQAQFQKLIGDGGLGRMGTDKDVQESLSMKKGQIGRVKEVSDRYEKMADEGMDQAATDAMRSKMASQMKRAEMSAGLKMGGAMGGAKGASAMANARAMQQQGMMGRANLERDLLLENEKAKERGLQGLSGSIAQESAAMDSYSSSLGNVKAFDLAQANTELSLKSSMGMQYAQMASAEEAARIQADAQIKMANAQKNDKFLGIF